MIMGQAKISEDKYSLWFHITIIIIIKKNDQSKYFQTNYI